MLRPGVSRICIMYAISARVAARPNLRAANDRPELSIIPFHYSFSDDWHAGIYAVFSPRLSLSFSRSVTAFVRQLDRARSRRRVTSWRNRDGARTSHDKYLVDKLWACSGRIAATTSILRGSRSRAITGSSKAIAMIAPSALLSRARDKSHGRQFACSRD